MTLWQRIKSWFSVKEPEKRTVQVIPYEVANPGQLTKWAVDVYVNEHLKLTVWFKKKPTKKQLATLTANHQ